MGAFSRSWDITKVTFQVMKKDKELILFPILAGFFSLLFITLMIFPTLLSLILQNAIFDSYRVLNYFMIFLIYLGLAFISTFFNVAVVYTAKKRFEGGDSKFKEAIKFSFSKIHLIFYWSLLSATVGLVLHVLENMSKKMGHIGKISLLILRSILGIAWSLATIFVIPGMVYDNLGPIDAIKKSTLVLRKTWGESIIRYLGLGLTQSLFFFLGIVIAIPLFLITIPFGIGGIIFSVTLTLIYFLGLFLLFGIANNIFNTALYYYATTGGTPENFTKDTLENAFKQTKVKPL